MLNGAGLSDGQRILFWAECANMATALDNAHVRKDLSNYEII